MNEEFLIYLWQFQLFKQNILTTDGSPLQIIHPGERNMDSGPDFFNARIRIGETTWAGNVEIHINSSDWFRHAHQNDPAFDNIILHVVLNHDKNIYRKDKQLIPALELKNNFNYTILEKYKSFIDSKKWIPCQDLIDSVNFFDITAYLDKLMVERLEQKAASVNNELQQTKLDFREVFYRKLARNFGFNVNGNTFELLAKSLPLKIINKHKNNPDQIEALLFGQAGFLKNSFKDNYLNLLKSEYSFLSNKYKLEPIEQKLWKFMRLRPANFPTIRISQFSQLLYRSSMLLTEILETEKLNDIQNLLRVETSDYWKNHFRFDIPAEKKSKFVGHSSVNLILINTIVPFLFVYGQHKADEKLQEKAINWLELIKAENNHIIKGYRMLGVVPQNAMQSQALLQLKSNYCDKKRCLECRIGHILLKSK